MAARPAGPLIWAHCPDPDLLGVMGGLADRLASDGDRLHMLITSTDIPANAPMGTRTILMPAPQDMTGPVQLALDHWRPDLILWMQGDLRPVLLSGAHNIPRLLIDADAARIGLIGGGWLPGLMRSVLGGFDHALAVDQDAAQRLRKAGMAAARIEVTGRLEAQGIVLPCNERERRDLAQTLGSRPVWLAAEVTAAELPAVIAAHRQASRTAHRLLLIVLPCAGEDLQGFATALTEAGFTIALRTEGAEPDTATQVYLVDNAAEIGLWYRLAPVTFMGSTMEGQPGGRHPFEAAALGSAVLHGPETTSHAKAYLRLSRAGATRAVRSGNDLGQAVEMLLAPDKAAAMAHAAWDVTTTGAEVSNRVIDLIRERLDRAGH